MIIPNNKYNDAMALKNQGKYVEAISAFEKMEGYKDSNDQIENCKQSIYDSAVQMMNEERYQDAINTFNTVSTYKDSSDMIIKCQNEYDYNAALESMNNGDYETAIEQFTKLNGYKDSNDLIHQCKVKIIQNSSIGDYVEFGDYNGHRRWLVLDKSGGYVLLLSEECIAEMEYNELSSVSHTWTGSYLYNWLNDEYYDSAFNDSEKSLVINSEFEGKVFLLSTKEAVKYFSSSDTRKAKYNGSYCDWWLRSKGNRSSYAAYISDDGHVHGNGSEAYFTNGVRPAIWISID